MKYELWYSESQYSGVLVPESDRESARGRWPGARVVWANDVTAYQNAWEECATLLDWGRRNFGDAGVSDDASRTIRLTCAIYRDERGEERSILVPGWLGAIPALLPGTDVYLGLIDHLPSVQPDGFAALLGHVFVERPGRLIIEGGGLAIDGRAQKELTVVNLHSSDGRESMWQEFVGHVHDRTAIRDLVEERLGADLKGWLIHMAHLFTNTL